MPELPEVETLCRQLNKILPGEEILAVKTADPRLGKVPPLAGKRIVSVERQGKCIRIEMENGLTAALHLRMTGRLLWQTEDAPVPLYTRLIILFATGRLALIDPRRFATFCVPPENTIPATLGNPLEEFPARRLRKIAGTRRLPVKSFLMDQRFIAGIGNIYACEILYKAAVDPRRQAGSLTAAEWRKVEKAAAAVLRRAVACRGTTVSDWRDLFGVSGTNQSNLEVYSREGVTVPPLWLPYRAFDDGRAGDLVLPGLPAIGVAWLERIMDDELFEDLMQKPYWTWIDHYLGAMELPELERELGEKVEELPDSVYDSMPTFMDAAMRFLVSQSRSWDLLFFSTQAAGSKELRRVVGV